MKYRMSVLSIICGVVLFMGCQEATDEGSGNFTNPNGDSQLALNMRDLFDQHMEYKKQLLAGKNPKVKIDIGDLHTMDATEPEKVASDEYKAFARSYMELVQQLEAAPESERLDLHNNVVQSCMNCHTALCPGPRVKIKKLFVSMK